jgi:2-polyprenyl-3-methyl-5-hydroxy-6-metoxy-1,4-benzoquinol methylase
MWALIRRIQQKSVCPSCGSKAGKVLGHKSCLFLAKRCSHCDLVYRVPTKLIPAFYEKLYHRGSNWWQGYLDGTLAKEAKTKLRETKWDYYDKLSLIQAVKPSGRVLDFGGGSGIIAYQLAELGYDAELFDISIALQVISRELLGIPSYDDVCSLVSQRAAQFDIILLHHVLEHIEYLPDVFSLLDCLLKRDGLLAIFVPNYGASCWLGTPAATLDSAHVCAFDASFFHRNIDRFGFCCVTFSMPYAFAKDDEASDKTRRAFGKELAIFAWKKDQPAFEAFRKWPYNLPDLRNSIRAQCGY